MGDTIQQGKSFVNVANSVIKLKRNGEKERSNNSVRNAFTEFSERSSIHGVQYLGERKLHRSERIWWIISLTISIFVCTYFIHQVWMKLTPVVITFNDEPTPISQIPFPTVTICNDIKVSSKLLNYQHHISEIERVMDDGSYESLNLSQNIIQQMYSASQICPMMDYDGNLADYMSLKNIQGDRNIFPHVKSISPDLLEHCSYALAEYDVLMDCKWAFKPVLTDYGLCYTFNHLSSEEIYKTKLLDPDFPRIDPWHRDIATLNSKKIEYPYRLQNSGQGLYLVISLPTGERLFDDDICSRWYLRNRLILFIHTAYDEPQISKFYYTAPLGYQAHLTVRPNLMMTDHNVINNYNKYQRKCLAEKENELKFFNKYTQSNCHLELLISETLERCNCTQYWMPRTNETKICSGAGLRCSLDILETIRLSNSTNECLPACDTISYDTEIYSSKIPDHYTPFYVYENNENLTSTIISMSFQNQQYFGLKRSESYGKIDLLAGCGGIVGLFMGVSFLSIVEMLYFATLRAYCRVRNGRSSEADVMQLGNEIGPLEMETQFIHSEDEVGPFVISNQCRTNKNST